MTGLQILDTATVTGASDEFKLNMPNDDRSFEPMIGVYGTIGTATITLQYKAPDDSWVDIDSAYTFGVGLYQVPKIKDVYFRLYTTAGGGSSLSAVVYGGES